MATSNSRTVKGRVRFSRPLTAEERDVLAVAAEILRACWDEVLPDGMAARMADWSRRLKRSHDALLDSLTVKP